MCRFCEVQGCDRIVAVTVIPMDCNVCENNALALDQPYDELLSAACRHTFDGS